jgi:hypothetical protein
MQPIRVHVIRRQLTKLSIGAYQLAASCGPESVEAGSDP